METVVITEGTDFIQGKLTCQHCKHVEIVDGITSYIREHPTWPVHCGESMSYTTKLQSSDESESEEETEDEDADDEDVS